MRDLIVKDITSRIGWYTKIVIYDRRSEEGTVFIGRFKDMSAKWDERSVVLIRTGWEGIILEID